MKIIQAATPAPESTKQVYLERIAAKTGAVTPEGCMPWLGATGHTGHGVFRYERRLTTVHRIVYLLNRGAIAEGHVIDHLCGRRDCVNPKHLRAITVQQNNEHRVQLMSNNSSGYPNVWWAKRWKKWQAAGNAHGSRTHLGYFATAWDAYCAWRTWAMEHAPFTDPRLLNLGPEDARAAA